MTTNTAMTAKRDERVDAGVAPDVVARSRDRRGVMLFAATVRHAEEVLASLPPDLSAMIAGDTPKAERASIIARFKAQRIKYLVSVAVLTWLPPARR